MSTTTTRRTNRRTTVAAIAERVPFANSTGHLAGSPADRSDAFRSSGRLNDTDAAALDAGLRDGSIVYVVRSYSTPIGWAYADGRAFVTAQRFSTTTSGHQTIARVGLGS